jgi:hypothetical protein
VTILDSFYQGSREAIAHLAGDRRLKVVEAPRLARRVTVAHRLQLPQQ